MGIDKDKLYTLDEAAELLGISRRTIQKHTRSGNIPARRLGRRVYIIGADLLNLPSYEPSRAHAGDYTLGELAERITGGNLAAMAKMLNEARASVMPLNPDHRRPRLAEIEPDADAPVDRATILDLFAVRSGDSVGQVLRELLGG